MTTQHTETIQRLWERFSRDQLAGIAPEDRRAYEQQFEDRFAELLQKGADAPSGGDGFLDLIGFGGKGPVAFEEMGYPFIQPDFDDSVVPFGIMAQLPQAASHMLKVAPTGRPSNFSNPRILPRDHRLRGSV